MDEHSRSMIRIFSLFYFSRWIGMKGVFLLFFICVMSCNKEQDSETSQKVGEYKGEIKPEIEIQTPHGKVVIALFDDIAPKHAASFRKLAKEGFYDGTTFHRVIPGFMIQGGDPLSRDPSKRNLHGTGGPGYTVEAEFSDLKHERGILSAARSADPNSAGSQFFLMHAKSPHLDGKYSVFGKVVSGMEAVDQIVKEPKDQKDNPLKPMTIKMVFLPQQNSSSK